MLFNCVIENGVLEDRSVDLLPTPDNQLRSYAAKDPWSLFVMLLLRYMAQAPMEAVKMLDYGGADPY